MTKRNEYISKVDKIIGNKIRYSRLAKGIKIEELAKAIDVTRVQMEKYESGINRIAIGRMLMIARALNEKVSYFYADLDSQNMDPAITRHLSKKEERMCMRVTSNFMKIHDTKSQNAVNSLLQLFTKESA